MNIAKEMPGASLDLYQTRSLDPLRGLEKLGIKTLRMKLIAGSLIYTAISILFISALTYFFFYDGSRATQSISIIIVPGVLLMALLAGLPFLLSASALNAIEGLAYRMEQVSSEESGDGLEALPDEDLEDVIRRFNSVMRRLNETRNRLNESLKAEEDCNQKLLYIQRAIENSGEAITIRDIKRNTVYHNRKQLDLYGYSAEELSATNGLALLCADPKIPPMILGALKAGDSWSGEVEIRTRTGRLLQVEIRANPVKDESGEVCGWVSIHKDVTDQRRAEQELLRLALFPEQNPNPVIEADAEGEMTYCNPAARNWFSDLETAGRNHAALRGLKEIVEVLRNNDEKSLLREMTINSVVYEQKIAYAAQSDRTWIQMSDVTERKQTELELARLASFPEQNPNPLIEVNFHGRVTYMNQVGNKLFPKLKEQGVRHPALEGVKEIAASLRTNNEESFFREVEINDSVYEQKITRVDTSNLVQIYMSDITERKKNEEAMARSLAAFLKVASSVSGGDLTKRGVEGSDALGEIAKLTNKMLDDVGGMLVDVKHLGLSLSSSAIEILAASEQMAVGAQRQNSEITSVSSAVEEMAASMMQVSRNAKSSARAAQEALGMAEHGDEAVRNTSEAMLKIDASVQHTAEKMRTLARRSSEISEIIELINEIAAQTNLLSLNAAIEAAHAGEAGQGFSVVAEEIRKLAERSARATKEVSNIIKAIQGETTEALAAMEDGMNEVRDGSLLAKQAGQVLQGISSVVKQSAELVEEIHVASEEEAKVTRNLANAMQTVSSIALQTAAGAEETAQTIHGLVELSERLNDAISRFKVKDEISEAPIYKSSGRGSSVTGPSSQV